MSIISTFEILLISLIAVLIVLVVILLVKNSSKKEDTVSPQLIELKKELEDMKTKQLETDIFFIVFQGLVF